MRSYSRAVDVLHAVPSADGSSSKLPPPVQVLLATCLSNRAQAYLSLAESPTPARRPDGPDPGSGSDMRDQWTGG